MKGRCAPRYMQLGRSCCRSRVHAHGRRGPCRVRRECREAVIQPQSMLLSLQAPSPSLRALAGLFPESSEMTSGAAPSSLEEAGQCWGAREARPGTGGGALWSPSTSYKRPIFGESLRGQIGGAFIPRPPGCLTSALKIKLSCIFNVGAEQTCVREGAARWAVSSERPETSRGTAGPGALWDGSALLGEGSGEAEGLPPTPPGAWRPKPKLKPLQSAGASVSPSVHGRGGLGALDSSFPL